MKEITLEEALKLVSFYHVNGWGWGVLAVNGDVKANIVGNVGGDVKANIVGNVSGNIRGDVNANIVGNVRGNVRGDIGGDVGGDIKGTVFGNIVGNVCGTINGREWKFVETPKDKLQRLITELGNQELIDTFNQLEEK